MSAASIPVQVHEDQLHLEVRTNNTRLTEVLTKLSATISRNAKALVQLQEEVVEIKNQMNAHQDKTQHMFERVEDLRGALHQDVQKNNGRLTTLEQTVVYQPQMQKEFVNMWQSINKTKAFIDEIESGGGERVSQFVSQYIEEFVPKWYDGVSGAMWQRVVAAIAKASDEMHRKIESRGVVSDDRAKHLVQVASADSSRMATDMNNERKDDLKHLKQFTEEQLHQLHHDVEHILATARNEADEQRHLVEGRFESIEESAAALRTTLCLEDDMCRELCRLVGGAEKAPFNLPLEKAPSDVRVQRVARIPHFAVLRASLQKELSEKLEFMKVDLHQCFVQEMVDVQRELKGKIGAGKFGELLAQYRDHQLYSQVKGLLADAQELRNNKVDSALFLDALKSKADMKSIERLVDRNAVTSIVGGVSNRVEELEHAMLKIGEKQDKLHFQNLRLQATVEHGGGGGGEMMVMMASETGTIPRRPSSLSIADLIKKPKSSAAATPKHNSSNGMSKPPMSGGKAKGLLQLEQDSGIVSAAELMVDNAGPPPIPDGVVVTDQRGIPTTHAKAAENNPNSTDSAHHHVVRHPTDGTIGGGGNSTGGSGPAPLALIDTTTKKTQESQDVMDGGLQLVEMQESINLSDGGGGVSPSSTSAARGNVADGGTMKKKIDGHEGPSTQPRPTGHHQQQQRTPQRRPISGSVAATNRQLQYGSAIVNKRLQNIGPDDKLITSSTSPSASPRGVVPLTGAQQAYAAAIDLEPTAVQKLTQPRVVGGSGKQRGGPRIANNPTAKSGSNTQRGTLKGLTKTPRPPQPNNNERDVSEVVPSFTQQLADRELAQMLDPQRRGGGKKVKVTTTTAAVDDPSVEHHGAVNHPQQGGGGVVDSSKGTISPNAALQKELDGSFNGWDNNN